MRHTSADPACLTPLFSVITPSFNQAEFIGQTIESVLAQRYPNFEHIVVDGGSTDGTVDILRSYPHLAWTSEPDHGQSDALNKGFARAKGDVIGWINSDDYYAPGAFTTVAGALEHAPLVLGRCQMVDRMGLPTELIANVEHSWFDILKYWIPDSIPTQPSIFFTRQLLERARRRDGTFVDPGLNYVMDYDLWLRMARHHRFANRVGDVLSYYRMYETNKTGMGWDAVHREASRVFARHLNQRAERRMTIVLPDSSDRRTTDRTATTIGEQSLKDIEMLVVGERTASAGRALVAELGTSVGWPFSALRPRGRC